MSDDFYSGGGYLQKHPDWHVGEASWKAKSISRILQKNNIQPRTVCEIGCGAGEILNNLYQSLPDDVCFTGFDISPQAIEMAKSRTKPRLEFHLGDLNSIPDERKFDLCLMIDVFEHVEDFYGFLKTARKKGIHFVFHIPLDLSAQSVFRSKPLLRKRKNVGHIHYFTKETALASLSDTGYHIKNWFYTGSYIDLPTKTVKSKIGKIPRRFLYSLNPDFAVRTLGGYSLMVLAE